MKKNLFILLAAVGLLNVSCSDDNGKDPVDPNTEVDIRVTATHALGSYAAKMYGNTIDAFIIAISDVPITGDASDPKISGVGNTLMLELYNSMTEDGVLPSNTYVVRFLESGATPRKKSCAGNNSVYANTDENGKLVTGYRIKDGNVEVSREGTEYTISLKGTLGADGQPDMTIDMSYKGAIEMRPFPYSPLKADREMDMSKLTNENAKVYYFADQAETGMDGWNFNVYNGEEGAEGIQIAFQFPAGETSLSGGIPAGTYQVGEYAGKAVAVPGTMEYSEEEKTMKLFGSWAILKFGNSSVGVEEQAPATGGSVTISRTEDGEYTLSFDILDDTYEKHHITGTWTGKPSIQAGQTGE